MINKKNKYYLFAASANMTLIFSTGAIIQSFFSSIGLSGKQIGVYTLCTSIIQVITLILSTFLTDKIKNVPKVVAIFTLPSLVFYSVMIYLCLSHGIKPDMIFILAIVACCFWNFFYGLRIVVEYKLPYYVTDISEYAHLLNISGIILSILGITVSGLFVFFSKLFEYRLVICVCFFLAMVFALIAVFVMYSMKNEKNTAKATETGSKIGYEIFTMPQTKYLAIPNFIRGIGNGIMSMAAVLMLACVTEDTSVSSSIATITAVATVLSCFIYSRIYKKIKTAKLILIGGILQAFGLLFLLCGKSTAFLIFYFIAFAGEAVVDYALPVFVTEIVSYEHMGSYASIRMLLFTSGLAVGNYMAGILSSQRPHLLVGICIAAQIITVVWYYLYYRLSSKKKG